MARKLKFANALVADFVAKGDGNKYTIVNAYSGNILVQSYPSQLAFGLYMEFLPETHGEFEVTFDIVIGGKKFANIRAGGLAKLGNPAVIALPQFSFDVLEDTTIEVVATADGYARTSVLKKQIMRASTSSAPPAD